MHRTGADTHATGTHTHDWIRHNEAERPHTRDWSRPEPLGVCETEACGTHTRKNKAQGTSNEQYYQCLLFGPWGHDLRPKDIHIGRKPAGQLRDTCGTVAGQLGSVRDSCGTVAGQLRDSWARRGPGHLGSVRDSCGTVAGQLRDSCGTVAT